jgi:hypothetical protein
MDMIEIYPDGSGHITCWGCRAWNGFKIDFIPKPLGGKFEPMSFQAIQGVS